MKDNFLFHPMSKEMSNGMRMPGNQKLSDDEIAFIKKEINRINADEKFLYLIILNI